MQLQQQQQQQPQTCPATQLQRRQILNTTDRPLDILTTDPLQVILHALCETSLVTHGTLHSAAAATAAAAAAAPEPSQHDKTFLVTRIRRWRF